MADTLINSAFVLSKYIVNSLEEQYATKCPTFKCRITGRVPSRGSLRGGCGYRLRVDWDPTQINVFNPSYITLPQYFPTPSSCFNFWSSSLIYKRILHFTGSTFSCRSLQVPLFTNIYTLKKEGNLLFITNF